MVLLHASHVTPKGKYGSIKRCGLLPRHPTQHNYKSCAFLKDQPVGVYVMLNDETWCGRGDSINVYWCGPMRVDPELHKYGSESAAYVIEELVPPDCIVLH